MSARGGQAIPSLDYSLAPYVAKTYIRNCVGFLKDLDLIPDTVDIKKNFIHYFDDEVTKDIEKPVEQNYSIMDHLDEIDSKLNDLIDISPKQLAQMHKVASRRTTEETEQALEAAVHNLCSMHSRAGSQTPFSSVNVGLSTTWEGRTVTYSLLKAVEAGLGLGETAIFPISIFKMKKGVTDKGSPNYDLFQYACKVSAKRLYPNFLSIDAPFNLIHYRKDRPEYQASAMGCRTRVIENKVDPQHAITEGRGNLFWTTINFPLIALDAKREAGVTNPIPIFMNKLHEIVNSVIQYSLDRFKVVAKRKAKNYPFMMGQHEYVGSEKLLPNDDIESVIKEGTMAVGFIGLSETLVALIGKHHGESDEAQELGLTILNTMKKWVDEASEKYGYNFGVMASPAEGCTGRLLRITRKKYGVIKGITDKEYFTNSFHICPTYKISAWKKVQLEAPYHAICTSGAISYVELDTDTVRNPQAFEELVNFMADSGCGYFAINHPMTRDPVCGYVGPLRPDGSCPRCGRKEFEGVAVNKLLSLTSYSPDPEYDVRLHENEDTTSNTL